VSRSRFAIGREPVHASSHQLGPDLIRAFSCAAGGIRLAEPRRDRTEDELMSELTDAIVTDHARRQLQARDIADAEVYRVLHQPEAVRPVRRGRVVAQALTAADAQSQPRLLRVFVDIDRDPPEVVTAYCTSKIEKYRSQP
jgi:hypothetical protein